jgi:hypothetical protein
MNKEIINNDYEIGDIVNVTLSNAHPKFIAGEQYKIISIEKDCPGLQKNGGTCLTDDQICKGSPIVSKNGKAIRLCGYGYWRNYFTITKETTDPLERIVNQVVSELGGK